MQQRIRVLRWRLRLARPPRRVVQAAGFSLAACIAMVTVQLGALQAHHALSMEAAAVVVWQAIALCGVAALVIQRTIRR